MKINFVLPFLSKVPSGGVKVMYEYANRLSRRGHDVCIYHSMKTLHTRRKDKSELRTIIKYHTLSFIKRLKYKPVWFSVDSDIVCKTIPVVANQWVRDADICISTWWATALEVAQLQPSKGVHVNLIQDIETNMTNYTEFVYDSYRLNSVHVAISDQIRNVVSKYNSLPVSLILNGIDTNFYRIIIPVDKRKRFSVIMLYANHERKGSSYGIDAFKILKQRYPDLEVILFSAEKPENMPKLPDWFEIHLNPDNLPLLYNNASVFLSPSIQEGLALPPMEAMACGCACVCTKIGGHQYLNDGINSLGVDVKDVDSIVYSISRLFDNDDLRQIIAKNASSYIRQYSWDDAVCELEQLMKNALT